MPASRYPSVINDPHLDGVVDGGDDSNIQIAAAITISIRYGNPEYLS